MLYSLQYFGDATFSEADRYLHVDSSPFLLDATTDLPDNCCRAKAKSRQNAADLSVRTNEKSHPAA